MADGAKEADVLVVGAGPVGLALALRLVRAGRGVVVVERDPSTAERSRAPAIWPGTQAVLAELGVLERFLAEGIAVPELALHDADRGGVLLRLPFAELAGETPHPRLLVLPQARTEALLCEALVDAGGEVRFATEAVGLEQDSRGVRLRCRAADGTEFELTAPLLAGCDGAHSTVREALGVRLAGRTYDATAALADVVPQGGCADLPFPRLTTRGDPAIGIRIDARTWRLILPFASDDAEELARRTAAAVRALFGDVPFESVWSSAFRLHHRLADRFAVGLVALAGDAAHLNSPVGGQGMNAGLQDTPPLAAALLEALESGDPAPLARYDAERRPAIRAGVNRFTDGLTRALLGGGGGGRRLRLALTLAGLALRVPFVRRGALRRVAMIEG